MIIELTPTQSINKALEGMTLGDVLLLNDGEYFEKVEVWVEHITIKAKNAGKVIISNHDYYHKIMEDGNECNTFRTYTMYIGSNHVTLEDLIIQNTSTPSSIYGQAVALHVDGTCFQCRNCTISSAQDTLLAGPMPKDLAERYKGFYPDKKLKCILSTQKYENCKILGDVDFIFGCGVVLFKNCDIITIDRNSNTPSYVCAPAHPQELPFGYLFYKCNIKGNEPAYLARPWRDYGCAAFIECNIGNHIVPEGFNKWNQTNRDKTARFYEYTVDTPINQRVPWSHQLNKDEAKEYIKNFSNFLNKNHS